MAVDVHSFIATYGPNPKPQKREPATDLLEIPRPTTPRILHSKGPCTQIVYTLAPKYLYRDYFKAKVSTIWVHGPFGKVLIGFKVKGLGLRVETPLTFLGS